MAALILGSFTAKRNGTTTNGWTNMAQDDYKVMLDKANDGARLKGEMKLFQ